MKHPIRYLLLFATLSLPPAHTFAGADTATNDPGQFTAWLSASLDPQTQLTAKLNDERSIRGVPIALDGHHLTLRRSIGTGSVDQPVARDQIRAIKLTLAGDDTKGWRSCLLIEGLLPLLGYFAESEVAQFDPQVEHLYRSGEYRRAVRMAESLAAMASPGPRRDRLRATGLQALLALGQKKRAAQRCEEWIASEPVVPAPAHPWQTLATLHEQDGDPAAATRAALRTLLFPGRGSEESAAAVDTVVRNCKRAESLHVLRTLINEPSSIPP